MRGGGVELSAKTQEVHGTRKVLVLGSPGSEIAATRVISKAGRQDAGSPLNGSVFSCHRSALLTGYTLCHQMESLPHLPPLGQSLPNLRRTTKSALIPD